MSRGRRQGPAYDTQTSAMLRGVALPPKLKCSRCDRHMGPASYSESQLNHARMAFKNRTKYSIKCRPCTGGQLVEIECTVCHKTQGLEKFAKIQRTKPDSAECFACTDTRVATAPVEEKVYEDHREAFTPIEKPDGTWPEYWHDHSTASNASVAGDEEDEDGGGISLNCQMYNLSVNSNNTQSATLIETDDAYSRMSSARTGGRSTSNRNGGPVSQLVGDTWAVAQSKSWHTGFRNVSSGFNANSYGNPASHGATGSSDVGTTGTFDSNQPVKGWQKIKAYVPEKQPEPEVDWESEEEEEADDDSDSDDSDYGI